MRLPETVPSASVDDIIYQSFHDMTIHDNKQTFATFELAYMQCFKPDTQGPLITNNVLRGENGMDLVVTHLEANAKPTIMNPNELRSTNNLIRELVELVHKR
jgi:hypothetical protein